jgi:integrase
VTQAHVTFRASPVLVHTLRHTCASILFAEGRNAVQVQRWLGHHSPSFTLDVYVHLLDGDLGAPLEGLGGNAGATQQPETPASAALPLTARVAA